MYDEMNSSTGSYYDTGSGYTHYDSSSNLHKPEEKRVWKNCGEMPGAGADIRKCVQRRVYGNKLSGKTVFWEGSGTA